MVGSERPRVRDVRRADIPAHPRARGAEQAKLVECRLARTGEHDDTAVKIEEDREMFHPGILAQIQNNFLCTTC